MALIFDINPAEYDHAHDADRYAALHDRLTGVLPADTLSELTTAVTGYQAAQNAEQAVTVPDAHTVYTANMTQLADACGTRGGYTVKELTAAAREITTATTLADTATTLGPAVVRVTGHRVRVTWHHTRPAILAGLADTLSARTEHLHELAALISADFTDAHAYHARDQIQHAWRDLTALAELVTLARDVERTDPRLKSPDARPVPLVLQLVAEPAEHGGTSRDLGLSSVGPRTLPDDRRHLLRELGARGARLTYRPHLDAQTWADQHFHNLPTLEQRRAFIRQLDDRWRHAA